MPRGVVRTCVMCGCKEDSETAKKPCPVASDKIHRWGTDTRESAAHDLRVGFHDRAARGTVTDGFERPVNRPIQVLQVGV